MNDLLDRLLVNQVAAVPLFLAVWMLLRFRMIRRRPALVHALWLVVLIKLITPPVVLLEVLPLSAAENSFNKIPVPTGVMSNGHDASVSKSQFDAITVLPNSATATDAVHWLNSINWLSVGCIFSLAVTGWCWTVAIRRGRKLTRLLKDGGSASARILQIYATVGIQYALRRVPRIVVADAPVSPMLWVTYRDAVIVLPQRWAESNDDEEIASILAHELAHFQRRDHLTNLLAYFVCTVFWWNPIGWWSRRELRIAAESCADAAAIERMRISPQQYARTLLSVADLVSDPRCRSPLIVAGFRGTHSLKRRVEMIADPGTTTIRTPIGTLLVLLFVATLPLLPTAADDRPVKDPAKPAAQQPVESEKAEIDVKDETRSDQIVEFTLRYSNRTEQQNVKTPDDRQRRGLRKFNLPDYLPACHGNVVEISPNHFFQVSVLTTMRHWHISYVRDRSKTQTGKHFWNAELVIPPMKELKQGDEFVLHKNDDETVIAYVEDDYTNDLDIGIRIVDTATGQIRQSCTLLREMTRYDWFVAGQVDRSDPAETASAVRPVEE